MLRELDHREIDEVSGGYTLDGSSGCVILADGTITSLAEILRNLPHYEGLGGYEGSEGEDEGAPIVVSGGTFEYFGDFAAAISAVSQLNGGTQQINVQRISDEGGGATEPSGESESTYDPVEGWLIQATSIALNGGNSLPFQGLSAAMIELAIERLTKHVADYYVSLGWSFGAAGGATIYSDGTGIFVGVARPGPVVSGGATAEGQESGWDVGPDSIVYQSGPVPVAGAVNIYYDPVRHSYYQAGDVWVEATGMYMSPEEAEAENSSDSAP